jgi:hypothetical protein
MIRYSRDLVRLWPLTLSLALFACDPPGAPTDRSVCWRTTGQSSGAPGFTAVSRDVTSLDDCAALLETYHLRGAKTANGAYQGYFIFVDDRQVSSSTRQDGFRYPIFQPSQRKEIDTDLRALIKEHGGEAPKPGDIAVERR